MSRLLGAVLAGGRSSRFGSDKAYALLGRETLLQHAGAAIAFWCDEVVIVGRDGGIPDLPVPGLGPLGGIAGALGHAAGHGFARVLTIGCDMPRLPGGLIDALLRQVPAYCADAPILGHWRSATAAPLRARMETVADRSVRRWAASIGAIPIASPAPLVNINTPADLLAL